MFEDEFVEWACRFQKRQKNVIIGPGDDAALVAESGELLVTTDLLADGIHFHVSTHQPELIGRKALAVSLSDIAAMGGRPINAVVQVMFPRSMDLEIAKRIQSGLYALADEFGVAIIGGDTNRWDGGLVIGTTVCGELIGNPWRIIGATAGDRILVSGSLGGSIAGHHLTFTPRCELAKYLATHYEIDAATDISDSLSIDLANMATSSRVGALLDLDKIPINEAARKMSSPEKSPLQHAMTDGEDFELIFAVDPETAARISKDGELPVALTDIGEFLEGTGIYARQVDGGRSEIDPSGYVH